MRADAPGRPDLLTRFLGWSAGLHLLAFLALTFGPKLGFNEPRTHLPSLRVDLVGLPTQKTGVEPGPSVAPAPSSAPVPSAAPIPPVSRKSKPKEVLKEKEKDSFGKTKKQKKEEAKRKLKQALERIKAIERIKALTAKEEFRGNRISKGTSATGEVRASLEAAYFDVVLERVRASWELPKWLLDQGLSAKVLLRIDARGQIKGFEIVKPSGNEAFDQEVRRALTAAAPFPLPPTEVAGEIGSEGILLGFPL
jgi:TonB family protein